MESRRHRNRKKPCPMIETLGATRLKIILVETFYPNYPQSDSYENGRPKRAVLLLRLLLRLLAARRDRVETHRLEGAMGEVARHPLRATPSKFSVPYPRNLSPPQCPFQL